AVVDRQTPRLNNLVGLILNEVVVVHT
ncbi:MAG: hypothetical protein RJA45_91, partial [Actinomycetota bacterium]